MQRSGYSFISAVKSTVQFGSSDDTRDAVLKGGYTINKRKRYSSGKFVLMTQYFNTIKDIGANSKNSSILMPHSPGGMRDFQNQIIQGTFVGNDLNTMNQGGNIPKGE